jgi:hypothetical protein
LIQSSSMLLMNYYFVDILVHTFVDSVVFLELIVVTKKILVYNRLISRYIFLPSCY